MQRLLYVSECRINEAVTEAVVAHIVADAQKRNADLGVTGALIFTGTHFAQVLEGCKKAIDELMISIHNDTRHGTVLVVEQSPITERQFSQWAMAYKGPAQFVSRHVTRLHHTTSETERQRTTNWLIELAREFLKP